MNEGKMVLDEIFYCNNLYLILTLGAAEGEF